MSDLPSTPPPEDQPAAAPKPAGRPAPRPRPVARRLPMTPESSKRDTLIAIACGAGVLLLIVFAMYALHHEQGKPSANLLTGVIVAKHASGETEKEISLGKKGLSGQETDSGFSFDVRVDSENGRTFEVPVNEGLYRSRKIGDTQSFIRPPSEQK